MEKDSIKKLKEMGKIKNIEESFKEFPPEEEWHKGEIDSFLQEEKEVYGEYNVGDIVFVENFSYSNGKKGRRHLFVIVEKDNYAVPIEYFAMLISSHLEKLKYNTNKLLVKNNINNLKRNSIVKTDAIYKIETQDILFKIGSVEQNTVNEYLKNLEKLY